MTKRLLNKVALITGGSRGMGAAIAKRLAKEGAKVAITYSASPEKAQEVVKAIQSEGGKCIAIQADNASPKAIKAAFSKTIDAYAGLDILVNNAGIYVPGPVRDYSLNDFDRMVNVNVRGLFVAIQEALHHLREGGRIINIGSTMSDYSAFPGASVYTMTKSAVAGLTKGLARELGARGININNVQPGPVDTDMNPKDGAHAASATALTALGRYGRDDEIASIVAYLASEESSFVTGANLLADGGFAA